MIALLLLLQSPAPSAPAVENWRVRTPPLGSWATLTGVIHADSFRNHLVTITADVSTVKAPEGAAPWMRVDGPGTDRPVEVASAWLRAESGCR